MSTKGPFALDNDIIFLSSSVNGLIGNHATHFFLSSEMGAAPIPDDKNFDYNVSPSSSANGPLMLRNNKKMHCISL